MSTVTIADATGASTAAPSTGPTLNAEQFSSVPHAGTLADPWPGSAIQQALLALPSTGGTVLVPDGVWLFDSPLSVYATNFNLVGQSLNAQLVFQNSGQLWFDGTNNAIMNSTISNLTINDNQSNASAIRLSNFQGSSFTGNTVLGNINGSIPAVFFEGGANNQILNNTFNSNVGNGGDVFQIQTLGGTPNSGFTVSQNNFDSSVTVVIGLSNVTVSNNHFTNTALGNTIGIEVSGPFSGSSSNITIDGNTLDATTGSPNGVIISGLPNDPGGTSNINGFTITNNILKGGGLTMIAVQAQDQAGLNSSSSGTKTNVTITGNQLSSLGQGSRIDISGGAYPVDNVLVESNTLQNAVGAQNLIIQDANTTHATIAIDDLASAPGGVQQTDFTSAIVGFSAADVIRVEGFGNFPTVDAATPTYNSSSNTTTLTLTDAGSPVATLTLVGNYSSDTFTVTNDPNVSGAVDIALTLDQDTGEQAALNLTVNGNSTTPIGAASAGAVAFTVAGLDPEDSGVVTFSDSTHQVTVNVNGGQSNYTANLSTLADGQITSSLQVSTDPAGNSFTPVAGNSATLDQDNIAEPPTLAAPSALTVAAGGSIPLGVVVGAVDSDDVLSVAISGVPRFESVTAAGATPTVTRHGRTFTYTFNALPAADWNNGLILKSSYAGTGQPENVLTVTVSNTTAGESATAPTNKISVTDPPAANTVGFKSSDQGEMPGNLTTASSIGLTNAQTTVQNPVGAPPATSPGLDHVVALFNQSIAAGFSDQPKHGVLNTNPLSQSVTNQEQFLAHPHHG